MCGLVFSDGSARFEPAVPARMKNEQLIVGFRFGVFIYTRANKRYDADHRQRFHRPLVS